MKEETAVLTADTSTGGETPPVTEKLYLKKRDYITFSMARFASSAISGLMQGYLLIFYTSVLGISPVIVGVMFLITKIFDGINDPIMGILVDKTRTRWGKMRPYLIFGAIPFGIVTILMFMPLTGVNYSGRIAFMYISYLAYDIVGTIVGVPLDGLPAVASPNSNERAKIISVSRVVGSIGEQSALVLYTLFALFLNMKYSFMTMGITIGVLAPVFLILGAINVKERIQPDAETPKVLDGFKYLFQNKQFLILITSNLLTFFRNLATAMIIYIVNYIYFNGSLNILFVLPESITSLVGMLLAPKLKRLMDAKKLFILATLVHSGGLLLVFLVGFNVPWIVTSLLLCIAMFPVGILNVVPHLMTIDTLDYWEDIKGRRQEGMAFAIVSLRSKVSSAFKDFFLAWLLAYFLFSTPLTTINDHTPMQLEFTRNGLWMIFTIIPAVLNLSSILPMLLYKLNGKKMEEINARLVAKRAAAEAAREAEELAAGEGEVSHD